MNTQFAVYKGADKEGQRRECFGGANVFSLFEVFGDFSADSAKNFHTALEQKLKEKDVHSLSVFETVVGEIIRGANIPLSFSAVFGYVRNNVLYIKTYQDGEVYIRRGGMFTKLVASMSSASGYIKQEDLFVFSTTRLIESIGFQELKKIVDQYGPREIAYTLETYGKEKGIKEGCGCFIQFTDKEIQQEVTQQAEEPSPHLPNKKFVVETILRDALFRLQNAPGVTQKKRITFIILAVIIAVLIWSVGLGVQRRQETQQLKKIKTERQLIVSKLQEAQNTAFLNLPKALSLVADAKNEFGSLKGSIDKKFSFELSEIGQLISSQESRLLKKEEKQYEEFFDLAVDEKGAQATKLSLSGDVLALLNTEKSTIYSLSLLKKSLQKAAASGVRTALSLANYQDSLFFYGKDGIFEIVGGKSKKIVEADTDWKTIAGLVVYNGNLYLLDTGADQIYKYLFAEAGYSKKTSYVKSGESVDLSSANSFTIDSSIYISFPDYIVKYTAGVKDAFNTSYPEDDIKITKVFTAKDLDKVYVWSKGKAAIYILGKNGEYERQIQSSILSKANDFVVYENNAYVLIGQKIYKINLQ